MWSGVVLKEANAPTPNAKSKWEKIISLELRGERLLGQSLNSRHWRHELF